jgi:hypothetical protein
MISTDTSVPQPIVSLFPIKLAVVAALIATLSLAFRPDTLIPNNPLSEDAFYALTVSRNIAHGNGTTIEGTTLTNGFQPLFTFLCAIPYLFSNDAYYFPLRIVILFHWLLFLGTAVILGIITTTFAARENHAARKTTFWITTILYLCSLFAFLQHFNGLETGCVLFLYSLSWLIHQRINVLRTSHLCFMGALLGLTVLARIDAVFLVIIVSGSYLILSSQPLLIRIKQFTLISFTAFVVSAPWFVYNLVFFSSLMPTSGQATMDYGLSLQRIGKALLSVSQCSLPFVYASRWEIILGILRLDMVRGLIVGAALVVFVLHIRRQFETQRFWNHEVEARQSLRFALSLLVFCGFLTVWYTLTSSATHFYIRYFAPLMLLSTFVMGIVIPVVLLRTASFVRRVPQPLMLLIVVPLVVTVGVFWYGKVFTGNVMYTQQVPLIDRHVPDQEYVAAFQSGTLGYFRPLVANLDGKVNSEALGYRDDIADYLKKRDIRWLCDWPSIVRMWFKDEPEKLGWVPVDEIGMFVLYAFDASTKSPAPGTK